MRQNRCWRCEGQEIRPLWNLAPWRHEPRFPWVCPFGTACSLIICPACCHEARPSDRMELVEQDASSQGDKAEKITCRKARGVLINCRGERGECTDSFLGEHRSIRGPRGLGAWPPPRAGRCPWTSCQRSSFTKQGQERSTTPNRAG